MCRKSMVRLSRCLIKMVSRKLHQEISTIIVVDRLNMQITSEEIATKIIDKFIQSGWTLDERVDHSDL